MGFAVPRSGGGAVSSAGVAAPTTSHAPMVRVDYGKLTAADESSHKQVEAALPPLTPAANALSTALARASGGSRPASRLDSTIARLRGSLGQVEESLPDSIAGVLETLRSGGARLVSSERKVGVESVFRFCTNI